jgi:protein-tyrosine phosphatase
MELLNFRDVSDGIVNSPIKVGRIFRSGAIDWCQFDDLHQPRTVINLRNETEEERSCPSLVEAGVQFISCPKPKSVECYDTSDKETRKWLNDFMRIFQDPNLCYPVLIHCRAGRDRTGVAVAALLKVLDVANDVIASEFSLGPVSSKHVSSLEQVTLPGFSSRGSLTNYFRGLNLGVIQRNIIGNMCESD